MASRMLDWALGEQVTEQVRRAETRAVLKARPEAQGGAWPEGGANRKAGGAWAQSAPL